VIQSFRNRKTLRFCRGEQIVQFRAFQDQATRRLAVLDNATSLRDLGALRSNRLEALSGDRKGQHSIRINKQWRICFRWADDGAYDVQIVDYHD